MKSVPISEPGKTSKISLGRVLSPLASPGGQLVVILILSLLYRMSTFGHPNMDDDEAFYSLVGAQMHHGALPYVDIWDRKPLGLFLIYYLIAGISTAPIAYQLVAWLSVALTAWFIALIAAEMSNRRAGLMAGAVYVAALPLLWGWGGQAPIFYNLPIVAAAWCIIKATPALRDGKRDRRVEAAMLLCGIAISIKQTALFESIFFGLFCAYAILNSGIERSRLVPIASGWILLGAMPTLLISAFYWLSGHWPEYWHAMFTSNLEKNYATSITLAARSINVYLRIFPLICGTLLGLLFKTYGSNAGSHRSFLVCWIIAAWVGFFSVPNIYIHYALPLLVPMSIASGLLFSRRDVGLILFALTMAFFVNKYNFLSLTHINMAKAALGSMERSILQNGGEKGLLIFDGPVGLYSMTKLHPMSPLTLPSHLNYAIEEDVSHLTTTAELARILKNRPGVVLMAANPRNNPVNQTTLDMVTRYVSANCRLVDKQSSSTKIRNDPILVYGACVRTQR